MSVDLVVSGGPVATASGMIDAGFAVDDGTIVAIGAPDSLPAADCTLDLDGNVVLPGVVDPHVHLDGFNSIDSYRTGTAAAALGGVTSVINFAWQTWTGERERDADGSVWANTGSLVSAVDRQRAKATDALVDYGLHATVTAEDPSVLAEFADVVEMGVTSVKFFTAYDIALSNGFLYRAFDRLADLGAVALVHTEDAAVCQALTDQHRCAGRSRPTDYPSARPDYTEAMALADALTLARQTGCQYYGVHTTSALACRELAEARDDGRQIRGETCTHYTALTESAYETDGMLALQAPPLRTERDVDTLFDALADGTLSVVSTDHVASTRREKSAEAWWDCPFGVNSLQTSLPVFYDEAVESRGYGLPFVVRVMCTNPARTFGLPRKGDIAVGKDADFVVFDPTATHTISEADNASRADYSIYDGREVTGDVKRTYVRGELVADEGRIVADPGHGQFLQRDLPEWRPREDCT